MADSASLIPLPAARSRRGLLTAPVCAATWRSWSFGALSLVTSTLAFVLVIAFIALSAALSLLVIGLPLLAGALSFTSRLATLERSRIHATFGDTIAGPVYRHAPEGASLRQRVRVIVTDRRRWAEALYVVAAFGLMLAHLLTLALAGAAIAAIGYPLYRSTGDLQLPALTTAGIAVVGLVALFAAPVLAQLVGSWQLRAAAALLGPDAERAAQAAAAQRIVQLAESRSGVLDAADAERRRIERDLHDGAQQRLVALGVELGMAKRAAADPSTQAVIEHAHREVKEALAELRDLVRGIHPAVLTDRGFDAALSALAARSPVPVTLSVTDPQRLDDLPDAVKLAAYFVAAEALTNVAKHAGASAAWLAASTVPDDDGSDPAVGAHDTHLTQPFGVRVTIADNGAGGAREATSGGLAGLRGRVEALDGTLSIDSPPGGGTRLTATIPFSPAGSWPQREHREPGDRRDDEESS